MATSITYANRDNHPMIAKRAGDELCTGWIEYTADWSQERLYAVAFDGRVKVSEWLKAGQPNFNKAGRRWSLVADVPAEAIYCGNYAMDMFS